MNQNNIVFCKITLENRLNLAAVPLRETIIEIDDFRTSEIVCFPQKNYPVILDIQRFDFTKVLFLKIINLGCNGYGGFLLEIGESKELGVGFILGEMEHPIL